MAIEKIRGIITEVRKHSDRHNVITLFAREQGRVALLAPASNGKSARVRNASLMPLSVISADINFNSGRELQFLGRFQRDYFWKDLYFNPVKSAIALFITEFVNSYTRNLGQDPKLWDFIVNAIETLDKEERAISNFHLAFLLDFTYFAGIRPDISEWRADAWFDMREGNMTIMPPAHRDYLSLQQSAILPLILRMNLRSAGRFKFNSEQRRELLSKILKYYSLHFPGLGSLKSPGILSDIFA